METDPKQRHVFLSAGWHNLLLFNYAVAPEVLQPYVPPGVEIDTKDGQAHLSLVGFQFLRTRVFRIAWPGFINFPEINLRFYIRYRGERGVCFVREYVPSRFVASMARWIYNEPYQSACMEARIEESDAQISAEYKMREGKNSMSMYAMATRTPTLPASDSPEHYFKEHELGVGRDRKGRLLTYRVHHPHWEIYPVKEHRLELSWGNLYGKRFEFLNKQRPGSVLFAVGSDIKVFYKSAV